MAEAPVPYHAVVSVDFGSFGAAVRHAFMGKPGESHEVELPGMSSVYTSAKYKNLSALLLHTGGAAAVPKAFGFAAKAKYWKMKKPDVRKAHEYYEHFKRHMFPDDDAKRPEVASPGDKLVDLPVAASEGSGSQPLGALVTMLLQFLKEEGVKATNRTAVGRTYTAADLVWVLTVPCVQKEMGDIRAIDVMRQCARDSGMSVGDQKNLCIVSEPVAAMFSTIHERKMPFVRGQLYVVFDIGGGTTDATCVKVIDDAGSVVEVCHRNGVAAGALTMDRDCESLLKRIFSDVFIDEFKAKQRHAWNETLHKFWQQRDTWGENSDAETWKLPLNMKLARAVKSLHGGEDALAAHCAAFKGPSGATKVVEYDSGSLHLARELWVELHQQVIRHNSDFLRSLLEHRAMEGCRDVVLVGGFSQSAYVRKTLEEAFAGMRFHTFAEPHLAVVKGGIWYFEKKSSFRKRTAAKHFGISVDRPWYPGNPEGRKEFDMNSPTMYLMRGCFHAYLQKGAPYTEGEWMDLPGLTVGAGVDSLEVTIYVSDAEECPAFKDDPGCVFKEKQTVKLGVAMGRHGNCELRVKVEDNKHWVSAKTNLNTWVTFEVEMA